MQKTSWCRFSGPCPGSYAHGARDRLVQVASTLCSAPFLAYKLPPALTGWLNKQDKCQSLYCFLQNIHLLNLMSYLPMKSPQRQLLPQFNTPEAVQMLSSSPEALWEELTTQGFVLTATCRKLPFPILFPKTRSKQVNFVLKTGTQVTGVSADLARRGKSQPCQKLCYWNDMCPRGKQWLQSDQAVHQPGILASPKYVPQTTSPWIRPPLG